MRDAACNDTDEGSDDKRRRYDLMVSCGHYLDSMQILSVNNDIEFDENSAASRLRAGQDQFLDAIDNYCFGELENISLMNAMPNSHVEVVAAIRSACASSGHGASGSRGTTQPSTEEICENYCLADPDLEYLLACCKKYLRLDENVETGECPRAPPDLSAMNIVVSPVMTFSKPGRKLSRSRSRSTSLPRTPNNRSMPKTSSINRNNRRNSLKSPRMQTNVQSPKVSIPKSPLLAAVANLNLAKSGKSVEASSSKSPKLVVEKSPKLSPADAKSGAKSDKTASKKRGRPAKVPEASPATAKSTGTKRKRSESPGPAEATTSAPKSKAKAKSRGRPKGKAKAGGKKRAKK